MATGGEKNQQTIKLVTMNIGYKSGGDEVKVKRRAAIANVLEKENPTLVFLQENSFRKFKVDSGIWKSHKIPEKYKLMDKGFNASFFYDSTEVTLTDVDQRVIENIKTNIRTRDVTIKLEDARMATVVAKTVKNREFLCISFHGVSNKSATVKRREFRAMLSYAAQLSKVKRLPLIIGGDYNFDIHNASMEMRKIVDIPIQLMAHDYNAFERREGSLKVDYFVTSKFLKFKDIYPLDWNGDSPALIFDHDPVVVTLQMHSHR